MKAEKDKMQRILDKLRKLMDLKESANVCGEVGEANAAAAGIARLLKEYDLTLQDIPSELKPADPVGEEKLDFTPPYMQYPWYWELCETVARHNGTTVLRIRTFGGGRKLKSVSYTIVGRSRNREVTAYLISFLCHQFIHIGRQGYPDWKWQQLLMTGRIPSLNTYMKNFLLGCVYGLDNKFREEEDSLPKDKMTALVKTDETAIEEFLADWGVKKKREGRKKILEEVFQDGYNTGRTVSIHKGLGQDGKKPSLLDDK